MGCSMFIEEKAREVPHNTIKSVNVNAQAPRSDPPALAIHLLKHLPDEFVKNQAGALKIFTNLSEAVKNEQVQPGPNKEVISIGGYTIYATSPYDSEYVLNVSGEAFQEWMSGDSDNDSSKIRLRNIDIIKKACASAAAQREKFEVFRDPAGVELEVFQSGKGSSYIKKNQTW